MVAAEDPLAEELSPSAASVPAEEKPAPLQGEARYARLKQLWEKEKQFKDPSDIGAWCQNLGLSREAILALFAYRGHGDFNEIENDPVALAVSVRRALLSDPCVPAEDQGAFAEEMVKMGIPKPEWFVKSPSAKEITEAVLENMDDDVLAMWGLASPPPLLICHTPSPQGRTEWYGRTARRWQKEGKMAALIAANAVMGDTPRNQPLSPVVGDVLLWAAEQASQGRRVPWLFLQTLSSLMSSQAPGTHSVFDFNPKEWEDLKSHTFLLWDEPEWEKMRQLLPKDKSEIYGEGDEDLAVYWDFVMKVRKSDFRGMAEWIEKFPKALNHEPRDLHVKMAVALLRAGEAPDWDGFIALTEAGLKWARSVERSSDEIKQEYWYSDVLTALPHPRRFAFWKEIQRREEFRQFGWDRDWPFVWMFKKDTFRFRNDRPVEDNNSSTQENLQFWLRETASWYPSEFSHYLPLFLLRDNESMELPDFKEWEAVEAMLKEEKARPKGHVAEAFLRFWLLKKNQRSGLGLPAADSRLLWEYLDDDKIPPYLRLWWGMMACDREKQRRLADAPLRERFAELATRYIADFYDGPYHLKHDDWPDLWEPIPLSGYEASFLLKNAYDPAELFPATGNLPPEEERCRKLALQLTNEAEEFIRVLSGD